MRDLLKSKRVSKGLSVADMAIKLQISKSFYYKIEQDTRNPTLEQSNQIAEILDDTIDNLFFNNIMDESSMLNPTGTE